MSTTLGHLGDVSLVSVETVGSETGLASALAKIGVMVDGEKRFYVVKSFASLSMPTEGENETVDMVLRELSFYTEVSHLLSPKYINIPAIRGSIVDFVSHSPSTEPEKFERIILDYVGPPWRLGNQLEGLSYEEIKGGVKALARLHCFPLDLMQAKRKWLSEAYSAEENGFLHSMTPFLRNTIFKVLPFLSGKVLTSSEEMEMKQNIATYVPNIHVDKVIETLEGLWKYWDKIVPAMKNAPLRLVHMDARGENMFFKDNESGECDVIFVDWQNVSLAPEGMDIAYLLTGSLTIEDRRKYEDELVKLYVDEFNSHCEAQGKLLSFEEVKERYQIGVLWPVLWTSCTLSGIEELLDSCKKTEPVARARAKEFMITTSSRYLQAAIDHSSISLIKSSIGT